jgi:hypothetical protein
MKSLYETNKETISSYEKRAIDILLAVKLLTKKDIQEPLQNSKQQLIQQFAHHMFVSLGRKTYDKSE